MAKQNNQIQALQMAAQTKRQQALNKVKKALVDMEENALPINIGTVAKLAGVSRTWLYTRLWPFMQPAQADLASPPSFVT